MIGFSPVSALVGGALIGLGAGLLWIVNGRVAGISNIFGSLINGDPYERRWRLLFLLGLPAGSLIGFLVGPYVLSDMPRTLPVLDLGRTGLLIAGLLIGFGTGLARGCTSGHGVFGIANLSRRSFASVLIFMATAVITVLLAKQWP